MDILNPTYQELEFDTLGLASAIRHDKFKPDLIVGLSRGGLFPALLLSHKLKVPLLPISYSSRKGKGDDKNHDNILPDIEEKRILIVDDIADSGHTLRELALRYERGHEVRTVVIYYKEKSVHTPWYYRRTIPYDSPFVNFPWEQV